MDYPLSKYGLSTKNETSEACIIIWITDTFFLIISEQWCWSSILNLTKNVKERLI